jgi:small conductance mechanosensitive channel
MKWTQIPQFIGRNTFLVCFTVLFIAGAVDTRAGGDTETVTEVEPDNRAVEAALDMPVEVLRLQIKHLSFDQLTEEADRWYTILRLTVRQLNEEKIEVWFENEKLKKVQAVASETPTIAQEAANLIVEQEAERKEETLRKLSELREKRSQVIDRLNVVLNGLSTKLGRTTDDNEQEAVLKYRRYVDAVKGIELDVSDTQSTRATVVSWLKSSEGGLRLARHVGEFLAVVTGFWFLSIILSKLVNKAMSLSSSASQIFRKFAADSVRRITFIVGLLLGLVALEVNITPLIAVIGAAGFVIAFALQNTLSNFASGLMIMFYKPFDIDDWVETSEFMGKVSSMTLVTTNVMTADNKLMVVPNNELWGKVITNVTGSSERRVDLVFGIGYDDEIALAERVLAEELAAHPLVLKEPEPVIRVAELADSSVNLICRPWVKTENYWSVYWEITRAVKIRFDVEGITIPFPQRDIHMHT